MVRVRSWVSLRLPPILPSTQYQLLTSPKQTNKLTQSESVRSITISLQGERKDVLISLIVSTFTCSETIQPKHDRKGSLQETPELDHKEQQDRSSGEGWYQVHLVSSLRPPQKIIGSAHCSLEVVEVWYEGEWWCRAVRALLATQVREGRGNFIDQNIDKIGLLRLSCWSLLS